MSILLSFLMFIMIVIKAILYFLIFVILIVLLIISLPIRYKINFEYLLGEGPEGEIFVNWVFGFVSFNLKYSEKLISETKIAGFKFKALNKKSKEKIEAEKQIDEQKDKKVKSSELTFSDLKKAIKNGIIEYVFKYFAKILKILKPKALKIRIVYGLDDPADTGKIYGIYCSVPFLSTNQSFDISPVFHEIYFDMKITARGFIVPITILFATINLIIKKPIRQLICEMRRRKRNGKGNGKKQS